MQFASARLQQRAIDAVAHQGMNERKTAAILPQELLIDQILGLIGRIAQKMTQHGQGNALAQDRGRLQGALLRWRQTVGSSEDQTLHRRRYGGGSNFAGMMEQLFEEERVAAGSLHAGGNSIITRTQKVGRELRGLHGRQRRKIDGADRRRAQLCPPAATERIGFGARRQRQHGGCPDRHATQDRQILQQRRVGPMDIFHRDEERSVVSQLA